MGGDGQVTVGNSIMKADAMKIRRLMDGKVLTGFAGGAADAFALLERFEAKLQGLSRATCPARPRSWPRSGGPTACCGGWRRCWPWSTTATRCWLTGTGDVIQPTDGILGIGSGGSLCGGGRPGAGGPLPPHGRRRSCGTALEIAAGIDIYTNTNIVVEELAWQS